MKKKIFAALALVATTFVFAACNNTNQKLSFNPNWEAGILSEATTATKETLTYEVTHTPGAFLNEGSFTVAYGGVDNVTPGTYTTTLEYTATGYEYKTELKLPVVFTLASGETVTKEDVITTHAVFKFAANSLQPVSSTKRVHCHSPNNISATTIERTYTEFDYEFHIQYNDDLTGGTLTRTDYSKDLTLLVYKDRYPEKKAVTEFEIDQKKLTYLDNEQLLFAFRGLSSANIASAQSMNVYNASLLTMEKITTTPAAETKTDFKFSLNGGEKLDREVAYIPVSIKSDNKHVENEQVLWYAKTTSNDSNAYRNVLLKMTVPMHYGLGSLTYTLSDATFLIEG